MDSKLITVRGKTSNGWLYCNIGKIACKNIYSFQDGVEGFFNITLGKPNNYIKDYIFCHQTL